MKLALVLAVVVGLVAPATAAQAAPAPRPPAPKPAVVKPAAGKKVVGKKTVGKKVVRKKTVATGAPVLVARWDFNAGLVNGRIDDTSGRGPALTVRAADQGTIRFLGPTGSHYVAFPDVCANGANTCPRALLEGASDADLNPGVRLFRWSARLQVTKAQVVGSSNVMQKGVAGTGSLWKMQIGATQGRAQCVVAGTGQKTNYIVRSTNSVADGAWHKVLCQRTGTALAVFVDGVARGQTTIPANLSIANSRPLRLGGPNFNTRSDMFHGSLDDVYAELG